MNISKLTLAATVILTAGFSASCNTTTNKNNGASMKETPSETKFVDMDVVHQYLADGTLNPQYTPSAGMSWVFDGNGYHMEVNSERTKGMLWIGLNFAANMDCTPGMNINCAVIPNNIHTSSYSFEALNYADHPSVYPHGKLTAVIPKTPGVPARERHLDQSLVSPIYDIMMPASQIYSQEHGGAIVSCYALAAQTQGLLIDKGYIIPSANITDNLVIQTAIKIVQNRGSCL